jgi:hypothetical protein
MTTAVPSRAPRNWLARSHSTSPAFLEVLHRNASRGGASGLLSESP